MPACGDACPPDGGGADAGVDGGADAGLDAGADAGAGLTLAPSALPPAVETRPYAYTFTPHGGDGGYHFAIDGGVPGFLLDVGGTLSTAAAPTPGTFPFAITVQDDGVPRQAVTTGFALEVRPFLRVASHAPLVEGRQGQAYSEQLSATGGQPPYTWEVDGGAPPPGVSLTDAGLLQGTPSASGSPVTFGVTVTDAASPPQQASRQVSVEVKVLDTLLVIVTKGAADGRVGTAYTQALKGYGGTPPYSWSVASGTLPPGVTLVDTGTLGHLGGNPTTPGTYSFTVRCADLLTSQTQVLSITVY